MNDEVRPGYVGNGALFKSRYKERPTHPDYNGDCEIDGLNYRLRAWVKVDKKGEKFLSIGFQAVGNVVPTGGPADFIDD
jgi:hypothetical protein